MRATLKVLFILTLTFPVGALAGEHQNIPSKTDVVLLGGGLTTLVAGQVATKGVDKKLDALMRNQVPDAYEAVENASTPDKVRKQKAILESKKAARIAELSHKKYSNVSPVEREIGRLIDARADLRAFTGLAGAALLVIPMMSITADVWSAYVNSDKSVKSLVVSDAVSNEVGAKNRRAD